MVKLLIIVLFPILLHFPCLIFTQNDESGDPENGDKTKEEKKSSSSPLLEEDEFSFLHIDEETLCLLVSEADIPQSEWGTLGYEDDCDPKPGGTKKCKLFTKELNPDDSTKECLKQTHLLCDPVTKKCLCSSNRRIQNQIRFQVGTKDGKNPQGRCFIRPTFDVIPGFDCAPGSQSAEQLPVDDDDDEDQPPPYCQCININETENFDTSDPLWWNCSEGSRLQINWKHVVVAFLALMISLCTYL